MTSTLENLEARVRALEEKFETAISGANQIVSELKATKDAIVKAANQAVAKTARRRW